MIIRFLINCVAVAAAAYFLPGVHVTDSIMALIWVTLVLSLLNTFLKPLLIILTIPVTIVTLGLFLLVINALVILIAAHFLDDFAVDGFWWALIFSLVVSIVNSLFAPDTDKTKRR